MATPGKGSKNRFFLYDNVAKKFVEIHDGFLCGRLEGHLQFTDDKAVSRSQCQFSISGNDVYIEDLNSTNRTKINGVPTQAGHRRRLHLYDVIEFGAQRLVLSHQDKFPANVQDRLDSGKLYPAARLEGGRLSSEISKVFTKKTLVLIDKATFRKLKIEEAFNRHRPMRRSTDVTGKPENHRSSWILAALILVMGLGALLSLWLGGVFDEGLPNDSGEIVLGFAVMMAISGAIALGFYMRMFRPLFASAWARSAIVVILALGAALGGVVLTRKTGILTRASQNLAIAHCVRSWNRDLCRNLIELEHGEWIRFPNDLRTTIEGKLRR